MSIPVLYVPQHVGDVDDPATSRRVIEYLVASAEIAGARVIGAIDDHQVVLEPKATAGLFGGFRRITIRLRQDHGALVCEVTTGRKNWLVWAQLIAPIGILGTAIAAPGHGATWRMAAVLAMLAFTAFSVRQTVQLPRRLLSEWLSNALEKAATQSSAMLPADSAMRSDLARLSARAESTGFRRRVRLHLADGTMVEGKLAGVSPTQVTLAVPRKETRDFPLADITAIDGAVPKVWLYRSVVWAYAAGLVLLPAAFLVSGSHVRLTAGLFTGFLVGGGTLLVGSFTALRRWFTKWERWLGDKPA